MKRYVVSHLKDMNRLRVYEMLLAERESSRAEIARKTGISGPTVLKIVSFLQECGLVEEIGEGFSAVGRKPQMLRFCPNRYLAVGMIFEGDYIRCGIVNLAGEILYSSVSKMAPSFEQSAGTLPMVIDRLLAEAGIADDQIVGIGLGVPGCYDPETHILSMAPLVDVNGQTDISWVEELLERRYNVPVAVGNDVNMDVLGEYHALGSAYPDFVYLSLGTGIGAGIILDGKLRTGTSHRCGEIGYMAFYDDYRAAPASPGWLEQNINLRALKTKFGFDPYSPDKSNAADICAYLTPFIAVAINNITTLLDIRHVSLGGIISESLGGPLIAAVSGKLAEISMHEIELARQTSPDPGISGASLLVLEQVIYERLTEEETV